MTNHCFINYNLVKYKKNIIREILNEKIYIAMRVYAGNQKVNKKLKLLPVPS